MLTNNIITLLWICYDDICDAGAISLADDLTVNITRFLPYLVKAHVRAIYDRVGQREYTLVLSYQQRKSSDRDSDLFVSQNYLIFSFEGKI